MMGTRAHKTGKALRLLLAAAVLLCVPGAKAALACTTCGCIANHHGGESCNTREVVKQEHIATRKHITEEFTDWETFLRDIMWGRHLHPAFMLMTEQMTAAAMHQMFMLGTMMDADRQIETQRLFAQMAAQAHRDYHPDMGMCVFGTNVRSLANTERNAEFTAYLMSQRSQDRQMGNMMSPGARGSFSDIESRMALFKARYCVPTDAGGELDRICTPEDPAGTGANKDIDYVRTIDHNATISLDFTVPEAAAPEEIAERKDILALANNLYAHDLMDRIQEPVLDDSRTPENRGNQDELLDMREVIAKRSVAEHSFNTIVGMKAMASPSPDDPAAAEVGKYMKVIMKQLGVTDEQELEAMVGSRPGYDAQMEILTRKIYEQPDFYVDLYEKPMNTERKKIAMRAIGLMQDFDTWQSYLRTEAILSVILELELMKVQTDVENKLNRLGGNDATGG